MQSQTQQTKDEATSQRILYLAKTHGATPRLACALWMLHELIEAGGEYPDAEYKAAAKHDVNQDELRAAYDDMVAAL